MVWFSNGQALAMAIAPIIQKQTIQNPGICVQISNGFRQDGGPCLDFKCGWA